MLEALLLVVLAVTLRDCDAVIDIVQPQAVVRHIPDRAGAAAALEVGGLGAEGVRPHFDAGAFGGVVHGDVAHEDVLHYVDAVGVLP